jgi:hypothetical protein
MLRISPSCRTNTMPTVATTLRGRSDALLWCTEAEEHGFLPWFGDLQAARTDLYVADSQVMAHIRLTAKEAVSPRTDLSL